MTNKVSTDGGRHLVTGLFSSGASAEQAYQVCVDRGYQIGEINVVMSDDTRRQLLANESEFASEVTGRKAEGGELGGPTGGRAAVLITVFAAVGAALALPALGLVLAGPITAALVGAGAAGVTAGLIGALADWGLPEDRVLQYEAGMHDGGILLGVDARSADDARQIERAWKTLGGRHVHA